MSFIYIPAPAASWADDSSYDFNGSTGYITTADILDCDRTEALSVAFWFKLDSIPGAGQERLLHKRNGTADGWWIAIHNTGRLRFNFENNSGDISWIQTDTVLSSGTWYHAICIATASGKADTDLTIEIDGSTDVNATTSSNIAAGTTTTGSSLIIGATDAPGDYFDGHLNEICGWNNTVINSTTKSDAYNSGTPTDPSTWNTPPHHYFKADGDTTGAGNVVDHGTTGGGDGTITGGVTIVSDTP